MTSTKENLYTTIRNMQGPKHPKFNFEALNLCADDISNQLKDLGLNVQEHIFYVEGDDKPYRNILGFWGELRPGMTLIGSHYDTVADSPAANDNLSAVAVSLELARLFALEPKQPDLCFAFFTLEEGQPVLFDTRFDRLLDADIIDKNGYFTSVALQDVSKELGRFTKTCEPSSPYFENINAFKATRTFSDQEMRYLNILSEVYEHFTKVSPIGMANYTVGSHHFVEDMHEFVKRAIVMDCLGWVGDKLKINAKLPLDGLEPFITSHQANPYGEIGDFLSFTGDVGSKKLLKAFSEHCSKEGTDFPHVALDLPIPYELIRVKSPDTLRSDHAPFWRKGIPALFISDTANFRSNRYHTAADTVDEINFAFLEKFTLSLFEFLRK